MIDLVKVAGDYTTHGFRSSFRSWAGESTSFQSDIVERCYGHKTGNASEQAYRRGAEIQRRRVIMDAWAAYVARGDSEGAKVFDFAARTVVG